jgi:solute carrier family 30 (zinc transporter), member 5/7
VCTGGVCVCVWIDECRYGRVNVLSAFINSVFLIFIAISVLVEAFARLYQPVEIHHDRLLLVSVLGLGVNLIGLFVFHKAHSAAHGHSHGGGGHSHGSSHKPEQHGHSHSHDTHGHSHSHAHDVDSLEEGVAKGSHGHDEALSGVYLHVLGDTLGSVAVIMSSLMVEYLGWTRADPFCSFCLAVVIFISVIPLLKSSATILLQRTPSIFDERLSQGLRRVCSKRTSGLSRTLTNLSLSLCLCVYDAGCMIASGNRRSCFVRATTLLDKRR